MNTNAEFELADKFRRVRQAMALLSEKTEIPHSELCLMSIIAKKGTPDGISVSEIASGLEVSPPAVSRSLRSLEERGLIERRINAENRRSTMVVLTEKGADTLKTAGEKFTGLMEYISEKMGAERLAEFNLLFREMMTYMSEYISKEEADSDDKNA